MKKLYFLSVISLVLLTTSCNNTNSKPSIKDNSVRNIEETKEDYSSLDSKTLHKHIIAHFNLGQYKIGKEKLNTLISNRPDLIDSLNLNELKIKFDGKLSEMLAKEQAIAEAERKARTPISTKNMRTYKKDGITYYVDNSSPEFDTKECFYAYFTKNKAGIVELFFKIRYVDTQWLDIENYVITIDQLDYTLTGEVTKSETKGKKKFKHELLDKPIQTSEDFKLLNSIANGSDVLALYVGKASYKKRVISKEQRLAIRNVIDAYLFMDGTNFTSLSKPEYTSTNNTNE